MKKYNYLPAVLLLPLLCAPGAQAADNEVTGFVMPSVQSLHVTGQKAKSGEYGDTNTSISGSAEVKSETDSGYVTFNADDIAQDTQSYKVEGGQYGKFKLDAFYNEIQHNNTYDAKTFYTGGVGTNQLTSPLGGIRYSTAPNPATWNTFDYEVSRNQYGAGIRLDMLKPFFANFSVSQEDRQGLKPIGAANSNFPAELPEPVDYKTNIIQAEVGYGKDPYFVSAGYTHSNFDNAYNALYFTDIYAAANQTSFVSLPPDNDYSKFDLKGRVKLPLKSALALAYSQSKAEADASLISPLNAGGTIRTLTLADSEFNGRVDTTNYSAVLTSSPLDFLDGKIFYKKYDTKNKSDRISIFESGSTPVNLQYGNDLFDYSKESYGIEAGFKLPGRVTLTPFYTKVETERPFTLAPTAAAFNPYYDVTTDDNIYGINAKWKGTDFISANIGYERLDRDDNMDSFTMKNGTAVLDPYTRESYIASQKKNTYKLGFDVFPTDTLSLGFTLKHKTIDYDETQIGLTSERGNTYGASANLTPNDTVSFSAYVDYETATREQLVRLGSVTAPTASPVDTIPTDAFYNATTTLKDKSFDWGIGVNVIAIPKTLVLSAQFDHTRSDGFADYTYGPTSAAVPPAGWTNDTIDFNTWDDYKKDALQLKGTYSLSAQVDLTGGYAYEKYRYSDSAYDNYRNVYYASSTALSAGYLTGANANPDYTANVVFLAAKYKF